MSNIEIPSAPAATPETLTRLVDSAFECITREDWGEARRLLEEARSEAPANVEVHAALGSVCFRAGDQAASIESFGRALELSPKEPDLWAQLAIAQLQSGATVEAEASVRRGLSLRSDDMVAERLLADILREQGSHFEAARKYAELIDRHPDQAGVGMALAACYESVGEWGACEAALRFTLQVDPENASAINPMIEQARAAASALPPVPAVANGFSVEVCCPTLNRAKEAIRLRSSLPDDCRLTLSMETKPRALTLIVNELFARSSADIVVMAADHLEFKPGCIDAIREGFAKQFPDLDGVVGINICNLPHLRQISEYCFLALGRKFIGRFYENGNFQGVFCPEYYHFYGDTEFGLFAEKIGKFHYDERAAVFTWHPNAGNAKRDGTYSASRSRKGFDDAMWRLRQSAGLYWGENFTRIGVDAANAEMNRPTSTPTAEVATDPAPRSPFGRRHSEKIISLLSSRSRVLSWGTPRGHAWLAHHLPTGATLAKIDDTATRETLPAGEFDLIVVHGEASGSALDALRPLLVKGGVVVLHESQRLRHDEAKKNFITHGHIGACADRPGAQLWWGGLEELKGDARATGGLPLVICFYTKDTDYELEAKKLIASCERQNLTHQVVGLDSKGSWEANCSLKANFVLETWKSSGRPVIWVDSDALLHGPPNLLRGVTADFAIHRCRQWQFASGTIFFNQTPAAGALLERWVARCRRFPKVWDQESLDLAWEETIATQPLETLWLPEPYCRIFDLHEGRSAEAAVIEHFQASRRLKAKVSTRPNLPAAKATGELVAARTASRGRDLQLTESLVHAITTAQAKPGRIFCVDRGPDELWRLLADAGHEIHGIAATDDLRSAAAEWAGDRIMTGTVKSLPVGNNSFDAVVCRGVLELLDDDAIDAALIELRRAAKTHVLVFVHTLPDAEDRWPGHEDQADYWCAKLGAAGFQPLNVSGDRRTLGFALVKKPGEAASAKSATKLTGIVGRVASFFGVEQVTQVEWPNNGPVAVTKHGGTAAEGTCALCNLGSLAECPDAEAPARVAELARRTDRYLWLSLPVVGKRDRAWWEKLFFAVGLRKHPLYQAVTPYEVLESEGAKLNLVFEKLPAEALRTYPLSALDEERDLHNDMTRVSGRRSDAHITRYMLARHYLPKDGIVLDGACGLGYGSAALAATNPNVQVVGLDCSDFAVEYAAANYSPYHSNLSFRTGDVCDLSAWADGSVALVVSFETVEHLREPEKFLAEVRRVLRPDGNFICSVPNFWVDEHGKDPNPWHFHVFDFAKITELCGRYLNVRDVFNQTAGGGMKLNRAPRNMKRVNLPMTQGDDQAEWWLVAASREKLAVAPVDPKGDSILVLTHDAKHPLFTSWLNDSQHPVVYQTDTGLDYEIPENTGLLVAADCYREPRASLIAKAMEKGIPTLLLADGILEYRNTFDHPEIAAGSIFQPARGHKVACIGRSQARILESWGNAAQVEVTGSARFDNYATRKRRVRAASEPIRILVMTAITPYFTEAQHELVRQSLVDLKKVFDGCVTCEGVKLEVEWRITKGLQKEIGVESVVTDLSGRELAEVLERVDAVISTPSTSLLEAMLLGLPAAVLDYTNSPLYVQPAWRITAQGHIEPVIAELFNPPAPKMLFQETVLHDSLECLSPAAPRLLALAEEMLRRGREARASGVPLELPPRLLPVGTNAAAPAENRFILPELYPGNPQFHERDLNALQVEVGMLRANSGGANPRELEQMKQHALATIQWRSKLEAGLALVAIKQPRPGIEQLMLALQAADASKQPQVILEAILEVSKPLSQLDPARARVILEAGVKLSQRVGATAALQQATALLQRLPRAKGRAA